MPRFGCLLPSSSSGKLASRSGDSSGVSSVSSSSSASSAKAGKGPVQQAFICSVSPLLASHSILWSVWQPMQQRRRHLVILTVRAWKSISRLCLSNQVNLSICNVPLLRAYPVGHFRSEPQTKTAHASDQTCLGPNGPCLGPNLHASDQHASDQCSMPRSNGPKFLWSVSA